VQIYCRICDRTAFSRRHLIQMLSVSLTYRSLCCVADTNQSRTISARTVADLNIQLATENILHIQSREYVISPDFWKTTLSTTIQKFAQLFELSNPNFYVMAFDDETGPNYAAVDGFVQNVADYHNGVLLIGERMSQALITTFEGKPHGSAVAGALAHELAHLFQFRKPAGSSESWWNKMLDDDGGVTRRRVELHADFLAGWCLGRSPSSIIDSLEIDLFARRLFQLGDTYSLDPNTHGTPQQRYAAMLRGFFLGRNENGTSVVVAAQEGELFLSAIVPMRDEP
jgi:hypothetical protein